LGYSNINVAGSSKPNAWLNCSVISLTPMESSPKDSRPSSIGTASRSTFRNAAIRPWSSSINRWRNDGAFDGCGDFCVGIGGEVFTATLLANATSLGSLTGRLWNDLAK
jgi:hypothetical protein